MLEDIVIDSVSVHPLLDVTVTVYVAALLSVWFAELPNELLHEYVPPPVAETDIDVVEQVIVVEPVLFVMPAVGAVVLDVMVILSVSVQPLEPVTVTVYVPADVIEAPADDPKLLSQLYEEPPVAVTLIDV